MPFLDVSKVTDSSYVYEITNNGLINSKETYYDYRGALIEYFVYKERLIEKCKEYSLELVSIKSFHEWNKSLNKVLSTNEQLISYLNFSFIFIKI